MSANAHRHGGDGTRAHVPPVQTDEACLPRWAGARAQPSRCPTRQQWRSVGRRVDGGLGARRRRRCQRRAHARNRRRSSGRQAATGRCRTSSWAGMSW